MPRSNDQNARDGTGSAGAVTHGNGADGSGVAGSGTDVGGTDGNAAADTDMDSASDSGGRAMDARGRDGAEGSRKRGGGRGASSTARLASLLFYLDAHPSGATASQIRTEVAGYDRSQGDDAFDRQFRRDRKTLEGMGFHVEKSDDAVPVYRLDLSRTRQDEVSLDLKDAYLLADCAKSALEDPDFYLADELANAMSKLKGCLGGTAGAMDLTAAGQARTVTTEAGDGRGDKNDDANGAAGGEPDAAGIGWRPDPKAVAESVREAIGSRSALSFRYRNANGLAMSRRVIPIKTFRYLGEEYMLAYDIDRNDGRSFKLDRFASVPEPVDASSGELDAAAGHAGDEPAVLPFQIGGSSFTAHIYFSAQVAHRAARLAHGHGTLEDHGRGKLWTVEAADEDILAGWVVENGPGILLVGPESAVRTMRSGLECAVEANSDGIAADVPGEHAPVGDLAETGAGTSQPSAPGLRPDAPEPRPADGSDA